MGKDIGHWLNGRAVSRRQRSLSATCSILRSASAPPGLRLAGAAEVDAAVQAAKAALPGWAGTTPLRRARVMFKLKELIERDIDDLASLVSAEHGKTLEPTPRARSPAGSRWSSSPAASRSC